MINHKIRNKCQLWLGVTSWVQEIIHKSCRFYGNLHMAWGEIFEFYPERTLVTVRVSLGERYIIKAMIMYASHFHLYDVTNYAVSSFALFSKYYIITFVNFITEYVVLPDSGLFDKSCCFLLLAILF